MADFSWPGHRIESLPFVDGTINTRFYDTLPVPGQNHDLVADPFNIYANSTTYERQAAIQSKYSQIPAAGVYPVNYSIIGEGRPVYFRVVGEGDLGVALSVYRFAERDQDGHFTPGHDEMSYDVNGQYIVPGWVRIVTDPYGVAGREWRKAAAVRLTLLAGEQYTIGLTSYSNRGDGVGTPGAPGYVSGYGQVMYFEADYDDIVPRNDIIEAAKEIRIYDNDRPYISAPVLNTDYTTNDHIEQVLNRHDPEALLDLQYTAWWRYRPLASGTFRAQLDMKNQEYFPGQFTPGVVYALKPKVQGNVNEMVFVNASRYNPPTGVPEAPYVEFDVNKGDDIYLAVGTYYPFAAAQKYVITAIGPQSRESFSLRMKDKKWELLSGGPYEESGLFNLRVSDTQWVRQVDGETPGATPLALRKKNNTWEDVLWFLPSEPDRPGRYTWAIDNISDYRGEGIGQRLAWVDQRTHYLTRSSYAGPFGDGHYEVVALIPDADRIAAAQDFYYAASTRSLSGWSGGLYSDFPEMVRYKEDFLGWFSLPLGALLAESRQFLLDQGADPKLNRVEIIHTLYGWSVDKSQMPWMNHYTFADTTNGLYAGVGALKQLAKQQLPDYEQITIGNRQYTVPVVKNRAHNREDGVILWTGDLNDLGTVGLIHGLTPKVPKVITQTLTPAFVESYTVDDVILYELMTSDLPDPDPITTNSQFYRTIENQMNGNIGIRIIYNVVE